MSSGPRTVQGKARSSGNARRHGLTGDLDEQTVLSWYRLLLEDETAVLDPSEQDPYRLAASELARSEAHLQRVRATEEQSLRGPEALSNLEKEFGRQKDHIVEVLVEEIFTRDVVSLVPDDEQWLLPRKRHIPDDDAGFEEYLRRLEKFVRDPMAEKGWDPEGFGLVRRLDGYIDRIHVERREAHEKVAPTLARYRALAEARRARALARWTDQVKLRSQAEGSR